MNVITAVVGALGVAILFSFILSWPAFMLWNGCLVGAIDGVNEISWLQAWGISILFNFLFKSHVDKK